MSHDVDGDARRLFDKSASTIGTISPGFTDSVLTEGARLRRTRRVTAAGGVAAAVLLVSAALWQVPDLVDNSAPIQPANPSGATTVTTPGVDRHFAEPADWVASLPRGEDVQAAYTVNQNLYAGDVSVPITGAHVTRTSRITVAGPVTDGWLATIETTGPKFGTGSLPQTGLSPRSSTSRPSLEISSWHLPTEPSSPSARTSVT